MTLEQIEIKRFLSTVHPYDTLSPDVLDHIAHVVCPLFKSARQLIYSLGDPLQGLFLIYAGSVEIHDQNDALISVLGQRNSFGERGLGRKGQAVTTARTIEDTQLLVLPKSDFLQLIGSEPTVARFFDRARPSPARRSDLATSSVDTLMSRPALTCSPETSAQKAAQSMADHRVSSICVTSNNALSGIVTVRDLSTQIVAQGLAVTTPVQQIMTADPMTLPPSAIGSDVLHMMMERRIGHVPITRNGAVLGIVTQTDLTRFQATTSAELVSDISTANSATEMAKVTARIPQLLVQLVGSGNRHDVVTRLITDIADTATRRLLTLAKATLGAPPVPYLWLACGSQGRQEQTGVSDQDNCLILHDKVTATQMGYFADLARFVCDGLNTCGYVYCPGGMMATNPRWCQPLRIWQEYFDGWMSTPSPEAQMLASVMFDLRPIGGSEALFRGMQTKTLTAASQNSLFVAHMVSNSLKHTPPLGLLRGFATIRSGEHKNTLDLKHNGVVPVTDLARIYALKGKNSAVNTRARLNDALGTAALSNTGGRDLIDAYDLIAETRLTHQSRQIKAGTPPDNFLSPADLSDFERSHLRDAFVVIKSLQSAVRHGTGMLG